MVVNLKVVSIFKVFILCDILTVYIYILHILPLANLNTILDIA